MTDFHLFTFNTKYEYCPDESVFSLALKIKTLILMKKKTKHLSTELKFNGPMTPVIDTAKTKHLQMNIY